MADISKIVLPDNSEYDIKDANALNNPVTENLILNGGSENSIQLALSQNNTQCGRLMASSSGNISVGHTDSTGSMLNGMTATSAGVLQLVANDNYILLRPNGDSTNQVYIGTEGDVHRNPRVFSNALTSTMSLTVSNQKVLGISGITAGRYLITASYNVTLTYSTTTHIYTNLYKSTSTSGTLLYSGHALNRNSEWINDVTFASFTDGSSISLYLEPNVACSVATCTLYLISLG